MVGKGLLNEEGIKMESGGLDRRKRSYPWMKSTAARTRGRQSWRASVDGGPAGAEDCAGLGLVGSGVRIGVQGSTMSLAMTRVKVPFLELGRSCCEGQWSSGEEAGCGHRGQSRVGIGGLGSREVRRLESEVGIVWMCVRILGSRVIRGRPRVAKAGQGCAKVGLQAVR